MSGPIADDRVPVSVAKVRDKLEEIRDLADQGLLEARGLRAGPSSNSNVTSACHRWHMCARSESAAPTGICGRQTPPTPPWPP